MHYIFGVGILQFLYVMYENYVEIKIRTALHVNAKNKIVRVLDSLKCVVFMIFAWIFFYSDGAETYYNGYELDMTS